MSCNENVIFVTYTHLLTYLLTSYIEFIYEFLRKQKVKSLKLIELFGGEDIERHLQLKIINYWSLVLILHPLHIQ